MAQTYDSAVDRKVLLEDEPLNLRVFALILIDTALLASKRVDFDRSKDAVDDILGEEFALAAERVALRTQLIPKPLDPASSTSTAPKLVQFFAVDPNRNALVERRMSGLIVENVGEAESTEETPLFLLNADEVWGIAHGDGFATEFKIEEEPAAAAGGRKSKK